MKKSKDYMPEAYLKARGWTDAMIREFGLRPVKLDVNPHFRRKAPMKLYSKYEVMQIEKTREFKQRMKLKKQRAQQLKPRFDEVEQPKHIPADPNSFEAKLRRKVEELKREKTATGTN